MNFSRETLAHWNKLTAKEGGVAYFAALTAFVILFHVALLSLLEILPQSKKEIMGGTEQPVTIKLQQPQLTKPQGKKGNAEKKASLPPVTRKTETAPLQPKPLTPSRPLVRSPQPQLPAVANQKGIVVPLEPAPLSTAKPLKEQQAPVVVGPSLVSPRLSTLLPNSSMAYVTEQQALGQKTGQSDVGEGGEDGSSPVDINTREYKYISYFDGLIRQIEGVWVYPEDALRAGMQGHAIYDIVINRDGSLRKVVGVTSTGFSTLDREIERAVKMAGPYNPVPTRIEKDPLVVRIRFTYTLTRFGIF